MPPRQTTIKTSVRLPSNLHADIEKAAEASGMTTNGEMVFRLSHDPRAESAKAVLSEIEKRDGQIVGALRKQNAVLWSVVDRADSVLEQIVLAMAQVQPGTESATLKREVEFARELIETTKAHR